MKRGSILILLSRLCMQVIKNNFIVITGGAGGGKSTLLHALEKTGYNYVGETGRIIIKNRLAAGLPPRPEATVFARQMFEMDMHNYLNNAGNDETLFFDRSFLDSAAMVQQTDNAYFEEIKPFISTHSFFPKVFFTPPWREIFVNDSERDQTFADAEAGYNFLYDWYKLNGYQPVILPKDTIEKRIAFVLDEINR